MADLKSLTLDAIDDWFREKIKNLAEVHHQSTIGGNRNGGLETLNGIRLARDTYNEMRALAGVPPEV